MDPIEMARTLARVWALAKGLADTNPESGEPYGLRGILSAPVTAWAARLTDKEKETFRRFCSQELAKVYQSQVEL